MHNDNEYKIFCEDNRGNPETLIPIGMCPIVLVKVTNKNEPDLHPELETIFIIPEMTIPVRILGGFVIQSLN